MPRSKLISTLISLLLVSSFTACAQRDYRYSDGHLHYVNFFQNSDGMTSLFDNLDAAQVDHAMISGMSMVKKWHKDEPQKPVRYMGDDAPLYWYSATDVLLAREILELPQEKQARLYPFITGFNPADMNAVDHIERMLEWYPGLWKGIGEVFTRHDDLTALTYGERSTADHPALARVYQLAAEHQLPVMIHSNITSTTMPDPIFLPELKAALQGHPQTRFIWAHAGTSDSINRRQILANLDGVVRQLLQQHSNLWIDLSWSVPFPYLIDRNGNAHKGWVQLIEDYPDRFFIGSDAVGTFETVGKELEDYRPFLDSLSEPVAYKVAQSNFLQLFAYE